MKILLAIAFISLTATGASAQTTGGEQGEFDRLVSLVGTWKAALPDGTLHTATYELASGGSAVIETLSPPDEPEMVTVYHRDGDALAMTHYCSVGNQPRMRAAGGEVGKLIFELVDVANLGKATDGHMQAFTLTFEDSDAITHEWIWREGGDDMSSVFNFKRVREAGR